MTTVNQYIKKFSIKKFRPWNFQISDWNLRVWIKIKSRNLIIKWIKNSWKNKNLENHGGTSLRAAAGAFFSQKNTFLKIVQEQKYSFSSKTYLFWRATAKWWLLQAYSRKMLPGTGYKFSVRIFLAMCMTFGILTKKINLKIKKWDSQIWEFPQEISEPHSKLVIS